jgi:NADH:ubiquinone oxidoreductase subunit 6 (subunit J)
MISINSLGVYAIFVPVVTSIFTVVARNPIHAILWLISTFLAASGVLLYHFKLGFTASLIIIVYIGAIAILFLFIIMMIPIKERAQFKATWQRTAMQFAAVFTIYVGGGLLMLRHVIDRAVSNTAEFWIQLANQLDAQAILPHLPTNEVEGISITDLYHEDIAIYGAELYKTCAAPILLCGLVLLFVLVAAIVLCKDE